MSVRTDEAPTEFDVTWSLMIAVDSESYDLVKHHLRR